MNKRLFYLAGILLLCMGVFFIVRKIKRNYTPPLNLPALSLTDLSGNKINIAGFTGKPLVINFWGTWCGPCRKELPEFEKAREKYGSQVNFIVISDEPVEKLIKFKAENSYTFLYMRSTRPFHELGFTSVPFTYFYNAKGRLVANRKDPLTGKELAGFIARIMQ